MIEINLKRKYGNRTVQKGIISIPRYGFTANTLELRDGSPLTFKQACALPEGTYTLVKGYANNSCWSPVFQFKPKGFPRKPEIKVLQTAFQDLMIGDIVVGKKSENIFGIEFSQDIADAFTTLFEEIFKTGEIVVLVIRRSAVFTYEDISMTEYYNKLEDSLNFAEEEEDEPAVMEHFDND